MATVAATTERYADTMTAKKNTEKKGAQSTPETDDKQMAARIKALAANPTTPAHVLKRISRLTEVLSVEGLDSILEDTPVMLAEQYRQAAPHATTGKAKKAKAELVALVERYATDADLELDAFAHHLSEVLRIARTHPDMPSQLYNDIADAWNEYVNTVIARANLWESEEYVRLVLAEEKRKKEAGEEGVAL
jgi:hypothetical protein